MRPISRRILFIKRTFSQDQCYWYYHYFYLLISRAETCASPTTTVSIRFFSILRPVASKTSLAQEKFLVLWPSTAVLGILINVLIIYSLYNKIKLEFTIYYRFAPFYALKCLLPVLTDIVCCQCMISLILKSSPQNSQQRLITATHISSRRTFENRCSQNHCGQVLEIKKPGHQFSITITSCASSPAALQISLTDVLE